MRAFGRDLQSIPLAARLWHRRYLGDIDDGGGAVLGLRPLVVDIRFVRCLGADLLWIGNAKKDAAVGCVIRPELSADLEVFVRVFRKQMASLSFVGHDGAVFGSPIGIAGAVPVVQGLRVRAVKKRDPT